MKPQNYKKIYDYVNARPRLKLALFVTNKYLPVAAGGVYILQLLWRAFLLSIAFFNGENYETLLLQFLGALLVPALTQIFGVFLRKRLNWKRPYEQEGFVPIVPYTKKGSACPSRHVLSAAVIAAVWCYFSLVVGIVLAICTLIIMCLRIITGAHSPRDVLAGLIFGAGMGIYGMSLFLGQIAL